MRMSNRFAPGWLEPPDSRQGNFAPMNPYEPPDSSSGWNADPFFAGLQVPCLLDQTEQLYAPSPTFRHPPDMLPTAPTPDLLASPFDSPLASPVLSPLVSPLFSAGSSPLVPSAPSLHQSPLQSSSDTVTLSFRNSPMLAAPICTGLPVALPQSEGDFSGSESVCTEYTSDSRPSDSDEDLWIPKFKRRRVDAPVTDDRRAQCVAPAPDLPAPSDFGIVPVGSDTNSWSKAEDAYLTALVTLFLGDQGVGVSGGRIRTGVKWTKLAAAVNYFFHSGGEVRRGRQCRERWFNHLDPDLKKGEWTAAEDRLVKELHKVHGNKWSLIAAQLKGRTEHAVKNRWHSFKKHY